MKKTKKVLLGSALGFGLVATAHAASNIETIRVDMGPLAPVATISLENELEDKTLFFADRSEEVIASAIETEYGLSEQEALELIMFDYSEDNIPTINTREDTIMLDTYVIGGEQTVLGLWVNGVYSDYWFNTGNVAEAIDAMATLAEVREDTLYQAIRAYNTPSNVNDSLEMEDGDMETGENSDDSNMQSSIVISSTVTTSADSNYDFDSNIALGYTFDVYLGNGKSTIEVYKDNGQLKEWYVYESDNRSEVVAQLAMRYQMTESELEARANISSDGTDDVDLENVAGRDDNLDPHEGDNYDKGQTPVAGY